MSYEDALKMVIENINDLLHIKCVWVSQQSALSDFLWGDTPENRAKAAELGHRLQVEVQRTDLIVDIAKRLSEKV